MALEVIQFRKSAGDKWFAVRLGGAKKNDKGQLTIYLDALPLPDHEGNVRITIQERQERGERNDALQHQGSAPAGHIDDEIPFAPIWAI